eukprot:6492073-Amphidinium_carterae.1
MLLMSIPGRARLDLQQAEASDMTSFLKAYSKKSVLLPNCGICAPLIFSQSGCPRPGRSAKVSDDVFRAGWKNVYGNDRFATS